MAVEMDGFETLLKLLCEAVTVRHERMAEYKQYLASQRPTDPKLLAEFHHRESVLRSAICRAEAAIIATAEIISERVEVS